ncbi:conserved hypothetical protein [Candidatus Brocadia pituitae]|nr:conserved hypothetical protein [Candidatus Brocadia pituitae]
MKEILDKYKDGKLIIRWDNAMHWRTVKTFPHHMHVNDQLCDSKEVTLEDVIEHIHISLQKN